MRAFLCRLFLRKPGKKQQQQKKQNQRLSAQQQHEQQQDYHQSQLGQPQQPQPDWLGHLQGPIRRKPLSAGSLRTLDSLLDLPDDSASGLHCKALLILLPIILVIVAAFPALLLAIGVLKTALCAKEWLLEDDEEYLLEEEDYLEPHCYPELPGELYDFSDSESLVDEAYVQEDLPPSLAQLARLPQTASFPQPDSYVQPRLYPRSASISQLTNYPHQAPDDDSLFGDF